MLEAMKPFIKGLSSDTNPPNLQAHLARQLVGTCQFVHHYYRHLKYPVLKHFKWLKTWTGY